MMANLCAFFEHSDRELLILVQLSEAECGCETGGATDYDSQVSFHFIVGRELAGCVYFLME